MIECESSSWFVFLTDFTLRLYNAIGREPTAADHRQGGDLSHHLFFAVVNPDPSAFFKMIVLQIRERNLAIQARRKRQRSDASNLFMIVRDDVRVLLEGPRKFQQHACQFLRYMPAMLDANDDLLTDVAALRVADRIVEAGLRDYGFFVLFDAEARDAGLAPQDL